MKIIRAYRIPDKITMGIFRLPCVMCVQKEYQKKGDCKPVSFNYVIFDSKTLDGKNRQLAVAQINDWLCELDNGDWMILTDKEYNELRISHPA